MASLTQSTDPSPHSMRWYDGRSEENSCRACHKTESMTHVITIPSYKSDSTDIDFFLCPGCGSLNTKVQVFTDYDDDSSFVDRNWTTRHYLQVGAGIDSMIRPLQRTRVRPGLSMIDIGCGFGFAVSYWNWDGGKGYGVEPSSYGKLGSELLDPHIYPAYLVDVKELCDRTYDRVFSSEVIEHVDDVVSFLEELLRVLSAGGTIVITTPNARFVTPSNDRGAVLAALSPGKHRVLFSPRALQRLILGAGLKHVHVEESGQGLIAFASQQPIVFEIDAGAQKRTYLRYLLDTIKVHDDLDLRCGLLFRAFREQVNLGDLKDAGATFRQLQKETFKTYQFDLTDTSETLQRTAGAKNIEEFGDAIPYFTPVLFFYAAMATLNGERLLCDARDGFRVSLAITEIGYRIAPDLFQEAASLYWLAKLHLGISDLSIGDHDRAQQCMEEIISASLPSSTSSIAVPGEVMLRARRECGVIALQTGKPELAMGMFRELIIQAPSMRADLVDLHDEATRQSRELFKRSLSS